MLGGAMHLGRTDLLLVVGAPLCILALVLLGRWLAPWLRSPRASAPILFVLEALAVASLAATLVVALRTPLPHEFLITGLFFPVWIGRTALDTAKGRPGGSWRAIRIVGRGLNLSAMGVWSFILIDMIRAGRLPMWGIIALVAVVSGVALAGWLAGKRQNPHSKQTPPKAMEPTA